MEIDIGQLHTVHPVIPDDLARIMVERAALALQRSGHLPGVAVAWDCDFTFHDGTFTWPLAELDTLPQHDQNRITEDGAEAVALVLVHQHYGWRVVRRMQREEFADWLLECNGDGRRELAALEVSGVARGSIWGRITVKLEQVAKSADVDHRWVGVIGFQRPTASLRPMRLEDHEAPG